MDKRNRWQQVIKLTARGLLNSKALFSKTLFENSVTELQNPRKNDGQAKSSAGEMGERRALAYLREHKLTLVESNYRCLFGEIDLIMRDQGCLVFVEVKQRKHSRFGSPLEMVSVQKQQKLRRSAEHYINHHRLSHDHQLMRFDVIGIIADAHSEKSIEWVQNAF